MEIRNTSHTRKPEGSMPHSPVLQMGNWDSLRMRRTWVFWLWLGGRLCKSAGVLGQMIVSLRLQTPLHYDRHEYICLISVSLPWLRFSFQNVKPTTSSSLGSCAHVGNTEFCGLGCLASYLFLITLFSQDAFSPPIWNSFSGYLPL